MFDSNRELRRVVAEPDLQGKARAILRKWRKGKVELVRLQYPTPESR
jgi:hypothetical protein